MNPGLWLEFNQFIHSSSSYIIKIDTFELLGERYVKINRKAENENKKFKNKKLDNTIEQ